MTTLLSAAIALLLPALLGVLLLALLAATALLVLLALLAMDVLLERNGVDRRAGARRAWDRLRTPEPVPGRPAAARGDAEPASRDVEHDAHAPRIPFSARRPARTTRAPRAESEPTESAPSRTPVDGPATVPDVPTVAPRAVEPPTSTGDTMTEVLAVEVPPAPRPRTARAPRVAPPRAPEAAASPEPPADRDSAIDRLFAPLLESDTTEPLPTPRAARPARKPRDQA